MSRQISYLFPIWFFITFLYGLGEWKNQWHGNGWTIHLLFDSSSCIFTYEATNKKKTDKAVFMNASSQPWASYFLFKSV